MNVNILFVFSILFFLIGIFLSILCAYQIRLYGGFIEACLNGTKFQLTFGATTLFIIVAIGCMIIELNAERIEKNNLKEQISTKYENVTDYSYDAFDKEGSFVQDDTLYTFQYNNNDDRIIIKKSNDYSIIVKTREE